MYIWLLTFIKKNEENTLYQEEDKWIPMETYSRAHVMTKEVTELQCIIYVN